MKQPPRKFWYGIGAALLVIGLFLGVGVGIAMIVNVTDKVPSSAQTFTSGGSTTVHFDAGQSKVLFVANAQAAGGHRVHCEAARGEGAAPKLERFDGTLTLNEWEAQFTITATDAGDYDISCIGAPTDKFGVGENASAGGFIGGVFGVLGGVGLGLAGVVVLVVTAVLRQRRVANPVPPRRAD